MLARVARRKSQFARRSPTRSVLRNWKRARGTPSLVERWSPRADADAHAGAVANATMPRHRHATLSVRERAVGVPFATARAIPPASTLERFHARCRRHNLAASRLVLELALRARPRHRACACFLSFAPGWHSLPQSRQTGQPPQTAKCVSIAVQDPRACARCRSRSACLRHRAPSRDLSGVAA